MKKFLPTLLAVSVLLTSASALEGPVRHLDETWNGVWSGDAVMFSPYRHGQGPRGEKPGPGQILEDLKLATQYWHFLRVDDCGGVTETILKLIKENQLPAKVLLTAKLIEETPANQAANDAEIKNAIRLAQTYPDQVLSVLVGDGTQADGAKEKVSAATLTTQIRTVRAAIMQPVSTSEDFGFWFKKAATELATELDYVSLKFQPVYGGRIVEEAIPLIDAVYDDLGDRYPDKVLIISETGWPTQHDPKGSGASDESNLIKGDTSVKSQSLYLKDHYRWVRLNKVFVVLMEAFDQDWRGGEPERTKKSDKHWGLFDEARKPKASFDSTVRMFVSEDEKAK